MKVSHVRPYSWDVPPPLPEQSGWFPPGTRSGYLGAARSATSESVNRACCPGSQACGGHGRGG